MIVKNKDCSISEPELRQCIIDEGTTQKKEKAEPKLMTPFSMAACLQKDPTLRCYSELASWTFLSQLYAGVLEEIYDSLRRKRKLNQIQWRSFQCQYASKNIQLVALSN